MNFKILMNVKRATFPSEKKNRKFLFFSHFTALLDL